MKSLVVLGPQRTMMWCQPRRIPSSLSVARAISLAWSSDKPGGDLLGDHVDGLAGAGPDRHEAVQLEGGSGSFDGGDVGDGHRSSRGASGLCEGCEWAWPPPAAPRRPTSRPRGDAGARR